MTEVLISADSHVRIPIADLRARVPESLKEAFDESLRIQAGIDAADRGGKEYGLSSWDMEAFKDPGYWEPNARLKAMDRDGVQAEVLYSELSGFRSFAHVRGDWRPISRAFLDLLSDFASVDPNRLAVSYQIPLQDIDYAVSEVTRLADLGARSVHLPNFPSELGLPDYYESHYDRLWGVLQETDISISHHLGNRPHLWDVFRRDPTPQAAIFTSLPGMSLAEAIGFWILPGTLERFPGLRIVFVESGLSWIPGYLSGLDRKTDRYDLPGLTMKPSDYFRRNMALTFVDEPGGLDYRHVVGVENIMWSTDFPHPATTWPNSVSIVEAQFEGVPAHERELIVSGNARRLYNL